MALSIVASRKNLDKLPDTSFPLLFTTILMGLVTDHELCADSCTFYNLQYNQPITDELSNITLIETFPAISTFQDTAEAISKVDLVVSIDSAVIHLTGAMGKPGIVLLNYAADWRWNNGFGTAPWYPSIQMFRQVGPGNWKTVFDQVSTFIKHTYLP